MKGSLLPIQNRILYRLAQGYSPPDIAEQLKLSKQALNTHILCLKTKGFWHEKNCEEMAAK